MLAFPGRSGKAASGGHSQKLVDRDVAAISGVRMLDTSIVSLARFTGLTGDSDVWVSASGSRNDF